MPDYVRAFDAEDYTVHRRAFVYETRGEHCPREMAEQFFPPEDCDRMICQLTSNTNESQLWCPDCAACGIWTALYKTFQAMGTAFATVWQDTDTINLTTGRVETDERKMAQFLAQRSDEESERLGMTVDMQIVDPTDPALGLTDEGLDATHDHQVRTGQKDSRGRFVF